MQTKQCPDCRRIKPIQDFGRNATLADGLQFYCKECCSRRGAATYRRKRARLGKTVRERRLVPAGYKFCPGCQQVRPHVEWHQNRSGRDGLATYCKSCSSVRNRRDYLKRAFNLDQAKLDELIREQGGLCAVCRKKPPEHIDHDHVTGEVRGVLCGPCNLGLGLFGDDIERLAAAVGYLKQAGQRSNS